MKPCIGFDDTDAAVKAIGHSPHGANFQPSIGANNRAFNDLRRIEMDQPNASETNWDQPARSIAMADAGTDRVLAK